MSQFDLPGLRYEAPEAQRAIFLMVASQSTLAVLTKVIRGQSCPKSYHSAEVFGQVCTYLGDKFDMIVC